MNLMKLLMIITDWRCVPVLEEDEEMCDDGGVAGNLVGLEVALLVQSHRLYDGASINLCSSP